MNVSCLFCILQKLYIKDKSILNISYYNEFPFVYFMKVECSQWLLYIFIFINIFWLHYILKNLTILC